MLRKTLILTVVLLAGASFANADIIQHWQSVDGGSAVPNTVQNSLITSTTADWTNAYIYINLTQGSIVDPISSPAALANVRNTILNNENDTWVDSPNNPFNFPTINNFNVPLSGYATNSFDWFDTSDHGSVTNGISARIYASKDAMGTFTVGQYDASHPGTPTILTGSIVNGSFATVPEPGTVVLLLSALVGLVVSMIRRK